MMVDATLTVPEGEERDEEKEEARAESHQVTEIRAPQFLVVIMGK